MTNKPLMMLAVCAVAVAGCSSRPRNFAPVLDAASADRKAYEASWLECREQIAAITDKRSGRLASAGGGVLAGAGGGLAAGAAAGATTGATFGGFGAAAAAGAAMITAVPVFGLAGAWGVSKIKKTKKEKAIKAATAECMAKAGYSVDKWRVMNKREVRALEAASTAKTDTASPSAPPASAEPR